MEINVSYLKKKCFSHKQFRRLVKKERRRHKRQQAAKKREQEELEGKKWVKSDYEQALCNFPSGIV